MTFFASLGTWETRQKKGQCAHRPYGCRDNAQDIGHDIHQNTRPLEFPDRSAQRGFLGTHPFYLFIPKDSKSVMKEQEEGKRFTFPLAAQSYSDGKNFARILSTTPIPGSGGFRRIAFVLPSFSGGWMGHERGSGQSPDTAQAGIWHLGSFRALISSSCLSLAQYRL